MQVKDIIDALPVAQDLTKFSFNGKWGTGWTVNHWNACREIAARIVSSMFDPDPSKLPEWLIGESSPSYSKEDDDRDPWVLGTDFEEPCGLYLVTLFRTMGVSNVHRITYIELTLGSFPGAADIFPLFAEILRQHVKRLSCLVVGRSLFVLFNCDTGSKLSDTCFTDFDSINDFGSTMEFDSRRNFQAYLALNFFSELRNLIKDLPNLEDIQMDGCDDEMEDMVKTLLEEKCTGVTFDLKQKR
ncbi:MAG: hypothetical protein Q9224_000783 [Gallowayella concinna]